MRVVIALVILLSVGAAHAESPLVKARPYHVRTPPHHDPARPAPLLLFLHPYNPQNGLQALARFGVTPITDEKGLLLAAPDGTQETSNRALPRFWNATDACCDFAGRGIDDVAYLDAVIADMRARYRVDDKRIFVLGYSNGGTMAHRLLCERSSILAGAVSIAGAAWKDPGRCRPEGPAALLEIHGDADDLVRYAGGGTSTGDYPSAPEGVANWARAIGCGAAARALQPLDLMPGLAGAETVVTSFPCRRGAAELWTVRAGDHRGLGPTVRAAVEFLLAHPKTGKATTVKE